MGRDFDIEERVQKAVKNFESGYNCAQSVFLAYSDLIGLDWETAKKVSVSLRFQKYVLLIVGVCFYQESVVRSNDPMLIQAACTFLLRDCIFWMIRYFYERVPCADWR